MSDIEISAVAADAPACREASRSSNIYCRWTMKSPTTQAVKGKLSQLRATSETAATITAGEVLAYVIEKNDTRILHSRSICNR